MKQTKNTIQFLNGFVNLPTTNTGNNNHLLVMSINSELMQFGYIMEPDTINLLSTADKEELIKFHNEVIDYLKYMTGSSKSYQPFWKGFPTQVMEMSEAELWLHQIIYYMSNCKYEPTEWTKERPTAFEQPNYTIITSGSEDKFLNIFTSLISVNQSLTPTDLEIVKWFVETKQTLIFPSVIPFKETLCTLAGMGLDVPVKTVTDVLRIAVHMSGGNTMLPRVPRKYVKLNAWSNRLSENVEREKFKFRKFSRSERKYLLSLLEKTNCDSREAVLKDSRWVRLGEILHPSEYKNKYPKAALMFYKIRNEKVKSWYGEVNDMFKISYSDGLKKLSERPGEFVRRLDYLLRNAKNNMSDIIIDNFSNISDKCSNKVLYELYQHLEKRLYKTSDRSIMIKGSRKRITLPDLPALHSNIVNKIQSIILQALGRKFSDLENMGDVYLHEDLKKIPLPTNMRSLNPALKPVIRGQRVPIGNQNVKVIRAFVHWVDEYGHEDIDLTATFMGIGKIKHIGWNGDHNNEFSCYSGDVRHRQGACAEYIDIDVSKAQKAGFKYVVLDARNYNGRGMNTMKECVFGYMEREFPESNYMFVPATLANTVRLESDKSATIVAVIDLETMEYIFLDIDANGIPVASANFDSIIQAIKPYTELPKFSVYDLLKLHIENRNGKIVSSIEESTEHYSIIDFPSYVEILKWMGI